jgi:ABC-2 type transport system ATP-binding protein
VALLGGGGRPARRREPISRFSKGMVQRLGLAQALINEPELLILDEPTEGLDLTGRQLLRTVAREFKASNRTIVLVSHVLPEVEAVCDRAAVVVAGKLAWDGELSALTRPPHCERSAGWSAIRSASRSTPSSFGLCSPSRP